MSKLPSSLRNFTRFSDARLQAVSSRNMYSEHGLEALIRPPSGQVCHSLMVSSYCRPGSAHSHAAVAMSSHSLAAGTALASLPSVRRVRYQSRSASSAAKNALGTRTLLLEF
jgi:hypothetical protein